MADNSEGIYSTRPWKVYGEGPSTTSAQAKGMFGGLRDVRPYSAQDIRFTQKKGILYAFCMKSPTEDIRIQSLGKSSKLNKQRIASVNLMGSTMKLKWKQEDGALVIQKPATLPAYQVVAFRIKFKGTK
jgi:alpha-L-fucosidase